ncbi:hypothetical protein [Pseudoalteromonas xiamenensis]
MNNSTAMVTGCSSKIELGLFCDGIAKWGGQNYSYNKEQFCPSDEPQVSVFLGDELVSFGLF